MTRPLLALLLGVVLAALALGLLALALIGSDESPATVTVPARARLLEA